MKLNALARGYAEGMVAVIIGQTVEHAPLSWSHHAARNASADHHHELFLRLAQIAVILLVDAVEFDELLVVGGELVRTRRGHRGGNIARQRWNRRFDNFVVRQLWFGSGSAHSELSA